MKRVLTFCTVGLLLSALLCGCNTNTEPDDVSLEEPETVAVLFSSLAEIWLDAGGTVDITVGETVQRGFASEGTPLVDEGAGKTVNVELLLSLEPDLVIASADIPAQVEAATLLEKAGIDTLLCHVESFADYLTVLADMTAITGDTTGLDAAIAMESEIQATLSSVSFATVPEILFVRAGSTDASTKAKLAEDHFACAMLEEFGCHNIASDAPILLDGLSMEAILLSDPDYIFFSLMGTEDSATTHVEALLAGATWGQLTAVQEGRVFILPKDLFHFKPCGRWLEAYQYLADLLTTAASAVTP